MSPAQLSKLFAALRLGLATLVTALFAEGVSSTSGYWLSFRAAALIGWWNCLTVVAALGFGLIGAAVLDQVFLEPWGLEIIPG